MNHCAICKQEIRKRDTFTCDRCGRTLCGKHAWYYVDEDNAAITRNSKPHCPECYTRIYGAPR